jgi:hypothetical protein
MAPVALKMSRPRLVYQLPFEDRFQTAKATAALSIGSISSKIQRAAGGFCLEHDVFCLQNGSVPQLHSCFPP